MNCPNCGLAAGENDKFCIGCGTRLAVPVPPAEEAKPEVVPEHITENIEKAVEDINPEDEVKEAAAEAPSPVIPPVPEPAPEPAEPVKEPEVPAPAVIDPKPLEDIPVKIEYEDEAKETETAPVMNRLNKPLSVWGYIWRILLFSLPILNIIPLFVMAFSRGINRNSKHFASAVLILMLIALILCVCGLAYVIITTEPAVINDFFGKLFGK